MRIGFIDFTPWDYDVGTVDTQPLGGSQSAVSYLAKALARRGHQVVLITQAQRSGMVGGIACLAADHLTAPGALARLALDALVAMPGAGWGTRLRPLLAPRTRLLLWTGHAHDQPAVQGLHEPAERQAYDAVVLVSQWQARCFQEAFGLAAERTVVLRNAVAPAFEGMFADGAAISAAKAEPPVLAYTTTPFRGLEVLLRVFPTIRQRMPGVRLRVISSMRVYRTPSTDDERAYGHLYDLARRMEGVEYVGSLPQPTLAAALRAVMLLAYPSTFAETSCITAMEALAAGCHVVTSDLGALAETTAGFAELVTATPRYDEAGFVERVVRRLEGRRSEEARRRRAAQVALANREYTWANRARQWEEFLDRLRRGSA